MVLRSPKHDKVIQYHGTDDWPLCYAATHLPMGLLSSDLPLVRRPVIERVNGCSNVHLYYILPMCLTFYATNVSRWGLQLDIRLCSCVCLSVHQMPPRCSCPEPAFRRLFCAPNYSSVPNLEHKPKNDSQLSAHKLSVQVGYRERRRQREEREYDGGVLRVTPGVARRSSAAIFCVPPCGRGRRVADREKWYIPDSFQSVNAVKMSDGSERNGGTCDLLVSLQISLRLLLHSEGDTFQPPGDLRRI